MPIKIVAKPGYRSKKFGGGRRGAGPWAEKQGQDRKKQSEKPVKPLGRMKKIGPKPGTQEYVQENYLLKPGYKKRKGMDTGGRANPRDLRDRDRTPGFKWSQRIRDSKKFGRRKNPDGSDIPRHNTRRMNKHKPKQHQLPREEYNIGGRANLLEEMGRIDARKHPDAADRAEKSRVIGELNRGYNSGGKVSPATHKRNKESAKAFKLMKGKPKLAKRGWK